MDITQLRQAITDYPKQLRAAMLHELELDAIVEQIKEEMRRLEEVPELLEDKQLLKLLQEMELLLQRKRADIITDPKSVGLTTATATKNKIEIVLFQDPDVLDLRARIEAREEALQVPFDEEMQQQRLEAKRRELEEAEKAAQVAEVDRQILQQAVPRSLEMLVQLAEIK